MIRIRNRIEKLEQRAATQIGLLPAIIIVPIGDPDRAAALAQVQRLRVQGREVFALPDGEPTDDALERFAP